MYSECGLVNDVPTGSKHTSQNGGQAWDVNTKLAAGMITMQYCMYIFKISTITCIQCFLGISIINGEKIITFFVLMCKFQDKYIKHV